MDTLRKLYMVTAENIRRAREKQPWQETNNKLQVGDLVFIRDPDSGVFEPRYSPNYRIITIHGANQIKVQDEKGHKSVRQTGHVKKMEPVDKVCHQLPPKEVYQQFGRASKLLIHPKDIPDIELLIPNKTINRKEDTAEVNEVIICNKNEDGEQTSCDKSEKSINTTTKQKGKQTANSEYSKEDTSKMDNSEKLIYHKNLIENSEIDDEVKRGHTKPFTKPSKESKNSLNHLDACFLTSFTLSGRRWCSRRNNTGTF